MKFVDRDEGEAWWVAGSLMQLKATGDDTHDGLTLIEQTCPPGLDSPAHVHPDEEQCLYMLDGTIEVTCGDTTRAIGPGAFVVMPRGVPHSFVVTGDAGRAIPVDHHTVGIRAARARDRRARGRRSRRHRSTMSAPTSCARSAALGYDLHRSVATIATIGTVVVRSRPCATNSLPTRSPPRGSTCCRSCRSRCSRRCTRARSSRSVPTTSRRCSRWR